VFVRGKITSQRRIVFRFSSCEKGKYDIINTVFNSQILFSGVLLGRLLVARLVKKFPAIKGPEFYYRVHNIPPIYLMLSQLNPVRALTPYFLEIRFNIILLFTPWFLKWSLPVRFYDRNIVCITSLMRATCTVDLILI